MSPPPTNSIIIFVDTNILIQCKPLEELDFNNIGTFDEISIIIPQKVLEEIDSLKDSGSGRKSQKARRFNEIYNKIETSEGEKIIINESAPKITLSFTPSLPYGNEPPITLNINKSDHAIVHEIILYRQKFPNFDIYLLSNDFALRRVARLHDFKILSVPNEWLLPPELDKNETKIKQLESKLKILENNFPEVTITFESLPGNPIKTLNIPIVQYEPISNIEIEDLVTTIKNKFPITQPQSDRSDPILKLLSSSMFQQVPPSQEAINKYENHDYPEWLNQLRNYFRTIHENFSINNNKKEFTFLIVNNGYVPAKDLRLVIEWHGDIFVTLPEEETQNDTFKLKIPPPPKRPQGQNPLARFELPDFKEASRLYDPSLCQVEKKDPSKFYKVNTPSDINKKIFSCHNFQHQTDPVRIKIQVHVDPNISSKTAMISFCFSASNIKIPAKENINVHFEEKHEKSFSIVENKLKQPRWFFSQMG